MFVSVLYSCRVSDGDFVTMPPGLVGRLELESRSVGDSDRIVQTQDRHGLQCALMLAC